MKKFTNQPQTTLSIQSLILYSLLILTHLNRAYGESLSQTKLIYDGNALDLLDIPRIPGPIDAATQALTMPDAGDMHVANGRLNLDSYRLPTDMLLSLQEDEEVRPLNTYRSCYLDAFYKAAILPSLMVQESIMPQDLELYFSLQLLWCVRARQDMACERAADRLNPDEVKPSLGLELFYDKVDGSTYKAGLLRNALFKRAGEIRTERDEANNPLMSGINSLMKVVFG